MCALLSALDKYPICASFTSGSSSPPFILAHKGFCVCDRGSLCLYLAEFLASANPTLPSTTVIFPSILHSISAQHHRTLFHLTEAGDAFLVPPLPSIFLHQHHTPHIASRDIESCRHLVRPTDPWAPHIPLHPRPNRILTMSAVTVNHRNKGCSEAQGLVPSIVPTTATTPIQATLALERTILGYVTCQRIVIALSRAMCSHNNHTLAFTPTARKQSYWLKRSLDRYSRTK